METIIGKTFKDTVVNMDFSSYEKCSFVNCVIHIDYGIFRAVNCDFMNCKLSLGNPASNVAKIIQGFFKDKPIKFRD